MNLLDNIKVFRRLAERHSFTGVAQELGVKQSTVSKSLAALEAHLGVQLFLRSTRGLSLTPEGQKLVRLGSPVLDQLDTVLAEVKDEKLRLKGRLRIATSLAFARLVLTPMLSDFQSAHPDVSLHFQLGDSMVNLVEDGIDLAIRLGALEDSSLRAVKIGTWKRAVYASPGYLKQHGKPKDVQDLARHKMLYYSNLSERPAWPFRHNDGRRQQVVFEPVIQSDGSDFLREAIIAGLGIALAPRWMMMDAEKAGLVVRLFDDWCAERYPINVVTAGATLSAKQRAFVDFVKDRLGRIAELSEG
jgi:LysR family transcriptional regulator for bpeEF and oprC